MLKGKKILLGICGGIAAYKMTFLVRLLIKEGAEVKVIMTQQATNFVTPLSLSTLSKNPVLTDIHTEDNWQNHVELGLWADLFIIAPLTANSLAKLCMGHCDNLLTAVYLSAKCTVCVAPAMDLDMWKHPSTKRNIKQLASDGVIVLPVGTGELASGLHGPGRMIEPEQILQFTKQKLTNTQSLHGKHILITSGPTRESIDPVRFITNHSSGKMGTALAEAACELGATVSFITGPAETIPSTTAINIIHVTTAADMFEAVKIHYTKADWCILAAAVADYTPQHTAEHKLKKSEKDFHIELSRTTDIAMYIGQHKQKDQKLIGFALETQHALENAKQKRKKKNMDMIVLNSLADKGAGFKHDTNMIQVIKSDQEIIKFPKKSKKSLAFDILEQALTLK